MLMTGDTDYEFRTTVVDELHSAEDMRGIGEWLAGDSPYFLQLYVDSGHVLRPGITAPSAEDMQEYRQILLLREIQGLS